MSTADTKANNSIMQIECYRQFNTWAFDDAAVGLKGEPFVAGAPEIIDSYLPEGTKRCLITFGAGEFPKHHAHLVWQRAEGSGNVYLDPKTGVEGWLCPALLKYFADPPRDIFATFEVVHE